MKQSVLYSMVVTNVRRMFLIVILIISGIFLSMPAFTQQKKNDCWTGVPGQSAPCSSQRRTTTCIQTPKFNTLYPISPYQTFKTYPDRDDGQPNRIVKKPVPSRTSPYAFDCKVTSSGPRMVCLDTYMTYNYRLSNIYETDTREVVKGFWNAEFREDLENMQTLAAKGTSLYPSGVEGNTFAVDKNEFDCIQLLSESERVEMEQEISREYKAGRYNIYKKQGLLFIRLISPCESGVEGEQ